MLSAEQVARIAERVRAEPVDDIVPMAVHPDEYLRQRSLVIPMCLHSPVLHPNTGVPLVVSLEAWPVILECQLCRFCRSLYAPKLGDAFGGEDALYDAHKERCRDASARIDKTLEELKRPAPPPKQKPAPAPKLPKKTRPSERAISAPVKLIGDIFDKKR